MAGKFNLQPQSSSKNSPNSINATSNLGSIERYAEPNQAAKLGALQRASAGKLGPSDVLTLQSTIGNKAVQRLFKQQNSSRASIQRLMTKDELIGLAGEPKEDLSVGPFTKKRSGNYKFVLDSLTLYDQEVAENVDISTGQAKAVSLQHRLENVVEACDSYISGHDGKREPRLQYIQQLKVSATTEIGELMELAGSIPNYVGQSFREALVSLRTGKRKAAALQKANEAIENMDTKNIPEQLKGHLLNEQKKLNPDQDKQTLDKTASTQANALYNDTDTLKTTTSTEFKKELASAEDGAVDPSKGTGYAFAFRSDTKATALLAAYAFKTGKSYFQTTILPTLSNALASESELKVRSNQEPDKDKREANVEQVVSMYRELMGAFTGDGAVGQVPAEIKQMAFTIYNEAVTKKQADPADAMQMVASFIFLRFINPIIISILSKVGGAPKTNLMQLSKILQNQANNASFKEADFAAFEALRQEYNEAFGDFLKGVVAEGAPKHAMV